MKNVLPACVGIAAMLFTGLPASAQPPSAARATLLIEAYNPDGSPVDVTGFVDYTHYVASSKWESFGNYGVFRLGEPPATASLASDLFVEPNGALQFISFTVPANQPVYFTSLWKAQGIGTVFMRADNAGAGYTFAENQRLVLQLPYEFALSEYALAERIHSGAWNAGLGFSPEVESDLARSAALIENARAATSDAGRAVIAYQALAVIMLMKERIVLEMSNTGIAQVGKRADFELNYEGFGGWTVPRFVPDYQRARSAGFRSVFTSCDWNMISPSPGVYDFTILDFQIDQAIALGYDFSLGVNQPISAMPPWARNLPFADLRNLLFENARRVVERYKGKVSVFYAHAEPELPNGGRTLPEMAEFVRASLAGAKAAAPNMPSGLYTSAAAYVSYQMNPQANVDYFSGWDLLSYLVKHDIKPDFIGLEMQYATVFAPIDLQRMQELLRQVADLAQVPVYIGETGYNSKAEDFGAAAPFYWHEGLTQRAQAEWADGVLRIAYALPFVKGLYWVHLDPDDSDNGSDFLSSLIGGSLFRPNGTPKRALAAFQSFADTITQYPVPTVLLDRRVLNFSAVTNGTSFKRQTSAQTIRMTQRGSGPVTWSATSNVPWLTVTPSSGAGSRVLTVSVQFVPGLASTASGAITITTSGAANALPPIAVGLRMAVDATTRPPFGSFDTPADKTTGVAGSIPVTGWALDDVQVTAVHIYRDPAGAEQRQSQVFLGDAAFLDGARPDVAAMFPSVPLSTRAGWGFMLLTNFLPNLGNGTFRLYAYADDAEGLSTLLGTKTIECANAASTNPFGAIDTPGQGATVSGMVDNFGWVLAPGTRRADPPAGGSVTVFIDGRPVGVPVGWASRSDLVSSFPSAQYSGVGSALGVFTFDSTTLTNGVHTIEWSVTDNQNGGAGVGSRYFTVSNGASLLAAPVHSAPLAAAVDAPRVRTPLRGRRGFNLEQPFASYDPQIDGRVVIQSEELERVELQTDATAAYLRTPAGLAAIPIGSQLASDGTFVWQPGVAFVGPYDFVFETPQGVRDVRIVLNPKGSGRRGPQTVIDTPSPSFTVTPTFFLAGWAADLDSMTDRGVDAVHVWAYPVTAAGGRTAPVFVGAAQYGGPRLDVAAVYGERFRDTGFGMGVALQPGTYDLAVFAYSTVANGFVPAKTVRVTVR